MATEVGRAEAVGDGSLTRRGRKLISISNLRGTARGGGGGQDGKPGPGVYNHGHEGNEGTTARTDGRTDGRVGKRTVRQTASFILSAGRRLANTTLWT